jgi:hypothetical protein
MPKQRAGNWRILGVFLSGRDAAAGYSLRSGTPVIQKLCWVEISSRARFRDRGDYGRKPMATRKLEESSVLAAE